MDELQQSIKDLSDRIEALTSQIVVIESSNQAQDTQLQAQDTALNALKVSRENKGRIIELERLSNLTLRTVRAFLTAALGYLLLQWATDRWSSPSLLDDRLADWLSMAAIACFGWSLIVISDKEQKAIDIIQSLPFFKK